MLFADTLALLIPLLAIPRCAGLRPMADGRDRANMARTQRRLAALSSGVDSPLDEGATVSVLGHTMLVSRAHLVESAGAYLKA